MKIAKILAVWFTLFVSLLLINSCNEEHVHQLTEWIVITESTCQSQGESMRYCTEKGCGFSENATIEKLPHTQVLDEEVPATCISAGYTAGAHCQYCDAVLVERFEIAMLSEHNYIDGICNMCYSSKELVSKEFDDQIPTFYIYTNGATIPDRSHPNYKDYAECQISLNDGSLIAFDETAKIRIRGTSSRWFEKKGYKIKFYSAKSLEGLPEAKKYNLLASYPDPCKLRDYLALSISYTMNNNSDRYAPLPILSMVYIDDEYRGLYFLVDDVDSGKNKIDLDKYTSEDVEIPFILEMDTIAYREGIEGVNYFSLGTTDVFDYDGDGWTDLLYVIDSDDNLTEAQFAYIENYIASCRNALVEGNIDEFSKLVDIASFIDYFLLGELFRNTDMAGRSVYMYRTSKDSKLIFGPSWDFDYTCSRPYTLGPNIDYTLDNAKDRFTNYDWWALFLNIPEAKELIKERYTLYLRDIYLHEFESAKEFFYYYEDKIKADSAIWYNDDAEDTDALVDDNFLWTFKYFELRLEMLDELFLIH
ncbi:MAG: CotH kinase family protein [Clostridia bacterium]|nr:CotH kinase family protein [Clostridia bacterium]